MKYLVKTVNINGVEKIYTERSNKDARITLYTVMNEAKQVSQVDKKWIISHINDIVNVSISGSTNALYVVKKKGNTSTTEKPKEKTNKNFITNTSDISKIVPNDFVIKDTYSYLAKIVKEKLPILLKQIGFNDLSISTEKIWVYGRYEYYYEIYSTEKENRKDLGPGYFVCLSIIQGSEKYYVEIGISCHESGCYVNGGVYNSIRMSKTFDSFSVPVTSTGTDRNSALQWYLNILIKIKEMLLSKKEALTENLYSTPKEKYLQNLPLQTIERDSRGDKTAEKARELENKGYKILIRNYKSSPNSYYPITAKELGRKLGEGLATSGWGVSRFYSHIDGYLDTKQKIFYICLGDTDSVDYS